MGQDLSLHSDSTPEGNARGNAKVKGTFSDEELTMRRRVWGVTLILDVFLSLQLGRPSAIFTGPSSPPSALTSTSASTLFTQTVSLARIISRINLHLYSHIGSTDAATTEGANPSTLMTLKNELDVWNQVLPIQFRIAIGHQPSREVIELNMLYHVAVILLYRPL